MSITQTNIVVPKDILFEIIYKVKDATTLCNISLTCKSLWSSLTTNAFWNRYIENHVSNNQENLRNTVVELVRWLHDGLLDGEFALPRRVFIFVRNCFFNLSSKIDSNMHNMRQQAASLYSRGLLLQMEKTNIHHFLKIDGFNEKGTLNFPVCIDPPTSSSYSSLYLAVRRGKIEDVGLLKEHLNFNSRSNETYGNRLVTFNIIHAAVLSGNTAMVDLLLENGADINQLSPQNECQNENYTPLHLAVEQGDENMVQHLLQKNADKNAINDRGRRPIDCTDNKAIIELLKDLNG